MSQTLIQPDTSGPSVGTQRWMVVIFNNDYTPMETVIAALMQATGCDANEAAIETWEAHHLGKAPVHFAPEQECLEAAAIIERVGVKTEVRPEWND